MLFPPWQRTGLLLPTLSKDTDDKYTTVSLGLQYRETSFLVFFAFWGGGGEKQACSPYKENTKTALPLWLRRRLSKKGKVQETQFPAGCGQSPQTLRRSAFL